MLSPADYPADTEEDFKFPMTKIKLSQTPSLPGWQDFTEAFPEQEDNAVFETLREGLGVEEADECYHQLLGWPDVIQNSMAVECDLVTQGYYLGDAWEKVPEDVRKRAEETALNRWILLFQLDMVENDDFALMFGDCGRIYFYITREDLLTHRFDRVWLILQCY